MSGQEKKRTEPFNPLNDIREFVITRHKKGDLPLVILSVVIVYNFIFFTFPQGFGIYFTFPFLMLIISFFTRYWEPEIARDSQRRRVAGLVAAILGLLMDLVVSLTFMINPDTGITEYESIPTLVLDILGLISISLVALRKPV